MPVGLNRELFKVFEKYSVGKAIVCLWKNGQLDSAIRTVGRERELLDILKDWLVEPESSAGIIIPLSFAAPAVSNMRGASVCLTA